MISSFPHTHFFPLFFLLFFIALSCVLSRWCFADRRSCRLQAEKEEKEEQEKARKAEIETREAKRRDAAVGSKKGGKKQ